MKLKNPNVAAVFLWVHMLHGTVVSRQVRNLVASLPRTSFLMINLFKYTLNCDKKVSIIIIRVSKKLISVD